MNYLSCLSYCISLSDKCLRALLHANLSLSLSVSSMPMLVETAALWQMVICCPLECLSRCDIISWLLINATFTFVAGLCECQCHWLKSVASFGRGKKGSAWIIFLDTFILHTETLEVQLGTPVCWDGQSGMRCLWIWFLLIELFNESKKHSKNIRVTDESILLCDSVDSYRWPVILEIRLVAITGNQ